MAARRPAKSRTATTRRPAASHAADASTDAHAATSTSPPKDGLTFPRPAGDDEPRFTLSTDEGDDNNAVLICGSCRGPNVTSRMFLHHWHGCHLACAHCSITGVMPATEGTT